MLSIVSAARGYAKRYPAWGSANHRLPIFTHCLLNISLLLSAAYINSTVKVKQRNGLVRERDRGLGWVRAENVQSAV